jgi:dihydrodipicolinate synthase/N-acetylneuraminate lyase
MPGQSSSSIKGVIATPFTPFKQNGEINEEVLMKLIDFQMRAGVNGFWILGTAGQGPAMTAELRMQACELIVKRAKGKVPVIVQVGSPDTFTAIKLAKHAESVGADAVSSLPPFYFPHNEWEIYQHFINLADAVKSDVYIYNNPNTTHIDISAETMAKMHAQNPRIRGVKESTDSLKKLQDGLKILPKEFYLFAGYERYLMVTVPFGGRGSTSIPCANSFPEVTAELYSAVIRKDYARAMDLQGLIYDIYWLFYKVSPNLRVASEEALKYRGIEVSLLSRWVTRSATGEERSKVASEVKKVAERVLSHVSLK